MRENRTYPLSFLFVLVTVFAVFIGMVANAFRGLDIVDPIARATLASALGGMVLGITMGCYHLSRQKGILLGGLIGLVIGGSCGCLFFVDEQAFPKLVASQIGGAVMILFLAAISRFGIRNEAD